MRISVGELSCLLFLNFLFINQTYISSWIIFDSLIPKIHYALSVTVNYIILFWHQFNFVVHYRFTELKLYFEDLL